MLKTQVRVDLLLSCIRYSQSVTMGRREQDSKARTPVRDRGAGHAVRSRRMFSPT